MFEHIKEAIAVFRARPAMLRVIAALVAVECGLIWAIQNMNYVTVPRPPVAIKMRPTIISEFRITRPDNQNWQIAHVMGVFAVLPDGKQVPVR
jgi:hypothetical protein